LDGSGVEVVVVVVPCIPMVGSGFVPPPPLHVSILHASLLVGGLTSWWWWLVVSGKFRRLMVRKGLIGSRKSCVFFVCVFLE